MKQKRRYTLRQVYKAMLYGVPKVKKTFWKKAMNKLKGRPEVVGACAIGRAALNLGEEDYSQLYDALSHIQIRYLDKKGIKQDARLVNYIIKQNDFTDKSIEDIA